MSEIQTDKDNKSNHNSSPSKKKKIIIPNFEKKANLKGAKKKSGIINISVDIRFEEKIKRYSQRHARKYSKIRE
jgi:hypothetical protein